MKNREFEKLSNRFLLLNGMSFEMRMKAYDDFRFSFAELTTEQKGSLRKDVLCSFQSAETLFSKMQASQ